MKILPLLCACFFCILISCEPKKEASPAPKVLPPFARRAVAKAIKFPLEKKFTALQTDSLTAALYKANHYFSFWHDSTYCLHVIKVLKEVNFDGLLPKDYESLILEKLFGEYFVEKKYGNDTLKQRNAFWKLEIAVTQNYLRYLKHLRFGKANPETIFRDWDYKREYQLPYTAADFSRLMNLNFYALVSEFRPQYPMYSRLRSVLYMLDSVKQNKSLAWDNIPYVGDLIVGDTSWVIPKIKQRLLSVDISHEDKLIHENTITNVFNGELLTMLNYFQKHTGLAPKWKIDKATVAHLNFTLESIEEATRVNMERCRWLLKGELPNYYILVNIADYTLRIYRNEEEVYKTKVVVGATNKETPIFHSLMTKVEFNPYWTVPYSIAGAEILPKLKADPNYLARNQMELIKDNTVVQLSSFSAYSRRYFPFVVRQRPSKNNSLGQVKFLFPNSYSVYLHDTPSKSLFERDVRAFSHGCIRVQKPMDFAAFLLSEQGINPAEIADIVSSGTNTPVNLKTGVPIIITYWTCFIDKNNQVFFFKDIYGRDKSILNALNR